MKKLLVTVLLASLTTMMLAGCSGNNQGNEQDPAGTEETGAANEEQAEDNAAEDEEQNAGDNVLTVGTNAEFPPFEYVGDDGDVDGFDMALIREIGSRIGKEVVIENMEFASLVSSIGTKIDVAIAGMTVTEERQETVDFSDSYYEAVQYVILPIDSEIASPADLEGKTIGVQLGTTGDFIVEEIPDAQTAQYNKAVDAVNDLINGRVDCVIIDKNPALVFADKFEGEVVAVDGAQFEFEVEQYAIAISKGNTELAEQINTALQEIKDDGTFDELVKTYIEE